MDAKLMPVVAAALKAYGLDADAIMAIPSQYCIGKFSLTGQFAAAAAAGTVFAARRLDQRFSQFINGWLLVIGYEHRIAGIDDVSAVALTAAEAADIIGATALRWTPSGLSSPQFRHVAESLGGAPFGLRQITQAAAANGSFIAAGPVQGPADPSRVIPADVIDLQNDALDYTYGVAATVAGGSTAPGASGLAFSVHTLAIGAILERGAIPGRPTGPCDADNVGKAVGNVVTQAMLR